MKPSCQTVCVPSLKDLSGTGMEEHEYSGKEFPGRQGWHSFCPGEVGASSVPLYPRGWISRKGQEVGQSGEALTDARGTQPGGTGKLRALPFCDSTPSQQNSVQAGRLRVTELKAGLNGNSEFRMSSQNPGKEELGVLPGEHQDRAEEPGYWGEAWRVWYLGTGVPYETRIGTRCLVTREGAQDWGQTPE